MTVTLCAIPENCLLQPYVNQAHGFTDCYSCTVDDDVSLPQFVSAFYNSWAFRGERLLLGLHSNYKSNAESVQALAFENATRFSAWHVEARTADQLLMRDSSGATRSWLKVEPTQTATRLLFGSAVVQRKDDRGEARPPAALFHALMPFHRFYSKALLGSAATSLGYE
ncbi:MAG: hypothetical protein ACI8Z1_003206 [Candidatus Azotimanducaceae bacterium]|jgi:hypothetical protein